MATFISLIRRAILFESFVRSPESSKPCWATEKKEMAPTERQTTAVWIGLMGSLSTEQGEYSSATATITECECWPHYRLRGQSVAINGLFNIRLRRRSTLPKVMDEIDQASEAKAVVNVMLNDIKGEIVEPAEAPDCDTQQCDGLPVRRSKNYQNSRHRSAKQKQHSFEVYQSWICQIAHRHRTRRMLGRR